MDKCTTLPVSKAATVRHEIWQRNMGVRNHQFLAVLTLNFRPITKAPLLLRSLGFLREKK